MKLTARRINTSLAPSPAWGIFREEHAKPTFRLVCARFNWQVTALPGPYLLQPSYDDEDAAREMERRLSTGMTLAQALAVVRGVLEDQREMHRQEAEAEAETERRAEAFWENRMSDEDKAREDWEYGMYGA